MKVAVSAIGPSLHDRVDERFGRANCFVVVDTETGAYVALDNGVNQDAEQGAGIAAAEAVSESGAEAVLTGHLGPKAFDALESAAIKGHRATGMTVAEAVAAFKSGLLDRLDVAAEKDWGR